ncbi:MAG: tetratricopeptide repeat protein, partial [Terriglobia bacterium]
RVGSNGRFNFDQLPSQVFYVVAEMVGYRSTSQRVDLSRQATGYVLLFLYPKEHPQTPLAPQGHPSVPMQLLVVPEEAREELERGRKALFEEEDFEKGQRHLREAIRLYPDYLDAYLLLGLSHINQQDWNRAEEVLRQALEINDRFPAGHFTLASLHKQRGRTAEARAELERGLELEPEVAWAQLELAQLLLEEELEAAEDHARRAHELAPEQSLVHVVLANILLRRGALEEAVAEYGHYLEQDPTGPLAQPVEAKIQEIQKRQRQLALAEVSLPVPAPAQQEYAAGLQALKEGKVEEALRCFRRATEIHPQFVEALHMTAALMMDKQEWEEAEDTLRRAVEIDEAFAPSYLALGRLYNLENRTGEAVMALERAVELAPHSWQAHFELANAMLAQNRVSSAKDHARQAHELGGTSTPLVHAFLGNIGLVNHDLDLALKEFQHYLDLAPNGPMAPRVRAKIQQIQMVLERQEN